MLTYVYTNNCLVTISRIKKSSSFLLSHNQLLFIFTQCSCLSPTYTAIRKKESFLQFLPQKRNVLFVLFFWLNSAFFHFIQAFIINELVCKLKAKWTTVKWVLWIRISYLFLVSVAYKDIRDYKGKEKWHINVLCWLLEEKLALAGVNTKEIWNYVIHFSIFIQGSRIFKNYSFFSLKSF